MSASRLDLSIPGRWSCFLRIEIDEKDRVPRQGDARGQVDGRGRLPNPPFWLAMAMIRPMTGSEG